MANCIVVYGNIDRGWANMRSPSSPSEEAAYSRARYLELLGHEVIKIEGPNRVIDKEEIERKLASS